MGNQRIEGAKLRVLSTQVSQNAGEVDRGIEVVAKAPRVMAYPKFRNWEESP